MALSLNIVCFQLPCGPLDQRAIEARSDVLVFDSAVLTEPFFAVGAAEVVLYIASNATDTDFTAKLTDVQPDGTSRLIQVCKPTVPVSPCVSTRLCDSVFGAPRFRRTVLCDVAGAISLIPPRS